MLIRYILRNPLPQSPPSATLPRALPLTTPRNDRRTVADTQARGQRAYKNLKPLHRAGIGAAAIAWGAAGLWLSERAGERYFVPTEEEKARMEELRPRVTFVDREK